MAKDFDVFADWLFEETGFYLHYVHHGVAAVELLWTIRVFAPRIADVQPEHEAADEEQADKSPAEEIFPEIKYTPTGQIIPDGFHWDGTRLVKSYKGSKRPESIQSDFWRMFSPKEREQLVAEEAAKLAGSSGGGAPSSSSAKASKKKKNEPERDGSQTASSKP